MPQLRCKECGWIVQLMVGEIPPCKECGGTQWDSVMSPKTPYKLTVDDRGWLKKGFIDPEV